MSIRKISDSTAARTISFSGNAVATHGSKKRLRPLPPSIKFLIKIAGYGPQPPIALVPSHIDEFEDNYVFDPQTKPHRDLILDHANENVEAVAEDEKYQLKKWVYFSICTLSNIVGFMLALYSLGKTPLFNSFNTNWTLFWVSTIFYAPTFCWLRVVFLPGRKENQWRKYVLEKRNWRRRVARERRKIFLGQTEDSDDEGAATEGDIEMSGEQRRRSGGDLNRRSNSFQGINAGNTRNNSFKSGSGSGGGGSGGGGANNTRPRSTSLNKSTKGGKDGKESKDAGPIPILQTPARRSYMGAPPQQSNKRISFQV